MQKDSAQAEISLKVVGGLLFLTHPVYATANEIQHILDKNLAHFINSCDAGPKTADSIL